MEINFLEKIRDIGKSLNPNYPIKLKPIKPLKLKKQKRRYPKKYSKTKHITLSDGFKDCSKLVTEWRSQPNPPKVYVLGHRVHHGLVCSLLGLAGLYYNKPYLVGFGLCGAVDDLDDVDHWLDFEVDGNSNYLVDSV